jgi:acyl carrier protein
MKAATQAALEQKTREILAELLARDENEMTPVAELAQDLGMDSIDRIEIAMRLEDELLENSIDEDEAEGWRTVADVLATVTKMGNENE